jgi:hypothetical protein
VSRFSGAARALVLFFSALWCGLLAAFGAAAGIVLSASPSRHAGGMVNKELLDALDVASYALAALLLTLVLFASRAWTRVRRGLAVRLLFVGAAAALASHLVVTPEMVAIRDRLPIPIDAVPKSDPRRIEWGRLHGLSAMTLLVRIAASAGLFVVVFGATLPPER